MAGDQKPARRGWRLMLGALRPHRRKVVLGVLAGLVWTAAKVSVPRLAGVAIDRGVIHGHHGALVMWPLIIVAVGTVQGVCTGTRRFLAISLAAGVETVFPSTTPVIDDPPETVTPVAGASMEPDTAPPPLMVTPLFAAKLKVATACKASRSPTPLVVVLVLAWEPC